MHRTRRSRNPQTPPPYNNRYHSLAPTLETPLTWQIPRWCSLYRPCFFLRQTVTMELGNTVMAFAPLRLIAALSYLLAASFAVSKVPSQSCFRQVESQISAAHRPYGLRRTPMYLLRQLPSIDSVGHGGDR